MKKSIYNSNSPSTKGQMIMLLEPKDLVSKFNLFLSVDNNPQEVLGWEYKLHEDNTATFSSIENTLSELEVTGQLNLKTVSGEIHDFIHTRFEYSDKPLKNELSFNPFVDMTIFGNLGSFGESGDLISVVIETTSTWQSSSSFYIPILAYIFSCLQPLFVFSADSDAVFDFVRGIDTLGDANLEELRQYPWRYYWSSMVFNIEKLEDIESSAILATPSYSLIRLSKSLIWIMDTTKIGNERAFVYKNGITNNKQSYIQDEALKKTILRQQAEHETRVKQYLGLK